MADFAGLVELAARLRGSARAAGHRRMLVLAGEAQWCRAAAEAVTAGLEAGPVLWISRHAPGAAWSLAGEAAHEVLGTELPALVFDAHSGFDPDAFGAVSGALAGGGLLLLLTPPLDRWAAFQDPEHRRILVHPFGPEQVSGLFLGRLATVLRDDPTAVKVQQGSPLPVAPEGAPVSKQAVESLPPGDPCRTPDQRRAVEAVIKVVTGQRRRPLVLTADRGRGKSAAFGIAAARLLQLGVRNLVVTGPRPESAAAVFEHAARLLDGAELQPGCLTWGERRMVFAAPDELLRHPPVTELVLVDEAAGIPAPLLEALLIRHARIAFATTVHGYEGTGRGFAVRFNRVLDRHSRGWRGLQLASPVRWSQGDPLEALVFRMLLLDAAAAPDDALEAASPETCRAERLDRRQLAADDRSLRQLFGLLVLAHYRTRPYDLRHLLDGPNLEVWVLRHHGQVAATALVAREGGFGDPEAEAVWACRARPHGHLIPETLAAHRGLRQAPQLRYARVMRIAVHPAVQRRGLGRRLLAAVLEQAREEGLDAVGSSFGATPELLDFWRGQDFLPLRVSVRRGAASGAHSVLMLRPLSAAAASLAADAHRRFVGDLPWDLGDCLQDLESDLVQRLLTRDGGVSDPGLDRQDWRDVVGVAFGRRILESALGPLGRLSAAALGRRDLQAVLAPPMREALILKLLQRRPWSGVAAALQVSGRAEVQELLRAGLRALVRAWAPAPVLEEAERLERLWADGGEAPRG